MTSQPLKHPRIRRKCVCGKSFETTQVKLDAGRGKFCSNACKYANYVRPSGLVYNIVDVNPAWKQATHGSSNTGTYKSWQAMKSRCLNPKADQWENYGGRGVQICPQWIATFETFMVDMGERPPGKTLDRIDTNGNYEPGNCRWSSAQAQAQNRRPRKLVVI